MKRLVIIVLITFLLALTIKAQTMQLIFNTNLSEGTTIGLPLFGTVDVMVNWGDGTTEENFTEPGEVTHSYASDGSYTVIISGNLTQFGNGMTSYAGADKLTSVIDFGDLGLTSLSGAFTNAANLTSVPVQLPSSVTNLNYLFNNASLFNQDINCWDVSHVTSMSYMFYRASVFNQPLNSWDVSQVTKMLAMFKYATSFNQDISSWNVSSVNDMYGMFSYSPSFNQDIGSWDVSNVQYMDVMFKYATSFNQDISNWNVSSIKNMKEMFSYASSFNQDIGNWNVGNVTNMIEMFNRALSFDQDIGKWNIGNVLQMNDMFDSVALSAENYDSLLIGWAQQTVQNNVNFSGGWSIYSPEAISSRQTLINTYGWSITDGGLLGSPEVSTGQVTDTLFTEATITHIIINPGYPAVIQHGVCWNKSGNPDLSDDFTENGAANHAGLFSNQLTGLAENTTYYVKAYAFNITDTVYGEEISFTTLLYRAPVLSTCSPIEITYNGAIIPDSIIDPGNPAIIQHGVCWNTLGNPDLSDDFTENGAANLAGLFPNQLTGLAENTTYYVKAYAFNSIDTVFGEEISFTTYEHVSGISRFNNQFPGLLIYPNPVIENLVITSANDNIESILIADHTGKLIGKITDLQSVNGTYQINMAGFTCGMYLLTIQTGDHSFTCKVMKH